MDATPRSLGARDGVAALVLAVAVLGAGWLRFVPGAAGAFHDDAVYVATAKALAEGDGYRLINLPGAPPQTNYPILYPALLALLWRCAGSLEMRLLVMQLTTLALAVLAIVGAYLYVVRFRYVGRSPALVAGILCASSPNLLYYATRTLSEMPFALALVASLWATDAYVRNERGRAPGAFATGLATGLPFLCRSVGIVMPLAAVAVAVRAHRPLRGLIVGSALAVLPWIAWAASAVGSFAADRIAGYQRDYLGYWLTNYFGGVSGSRPGTALAIVGANLGKACTAIGNIAFEGVAQGLYETSASAPILLGLVGGVAWLAVLMERRFATLPATLLAYLALVCVWPWPPDRFMVPLLFFLLALALERATRATARLGAARLGVPILALVALVGTIPNLRVLSEYATASARSHYPYFMLPGEPVAWSSYAEAFDWLETHAGPDTVLAAGFDSMTALYTGRPTVRPFLPRPSALYYATVTGDDRPALGSPKDLAQALTTYGARYLFVSPMPAFPEEEAFYELVIELQTERPGFLRSVYQGPDPRFVIFEVAAASAKP